MIVSLIDDFLNKITMYRLVFYCLFFVWLAGFMFSFLGVMPFGPLDTIASFAVLVASSFLTNRIFKKIFNAPANTESTYITAFILALTMGPEESMQGFLFLVLASFTAIASKYILAIGKKHIFNPAAFSMVFCALVFNYYPSWWIGSIFMTPLVIAIGFLVVRKLKRTDLVLSFLVGFIAVSFGTVISWETITFFTKELLAYSPILFFTFIMLTEPTTTPPTRSLRLAYGSAVALLLAPFVHLGGIYFSPELALLAGNLFSYLVSPKEKLILMLKVKNNIAGNVHEFIFYADRKLHFKPGQYLEWTLAHPKQDSRGMRRYFTIASSPTEREIKIGVKFYPKPSSYKTTLESLKLQDSIVASQLAGEFTLPKNKNKKLVFLAGGIGVTPFRSMVKYLLDNNEKRDIIIFYANTNFKDIAYQEIFKEAEVKLGIKTIHVLNNTSGVPLDFKHREGFINQKMIVKNTPDYKERTYYISGPRMMIVSFEKILKEMGIPKNHIKTDFFPGFA